jgi:hypothetical protein
MDPFAGRSNVELNRRLCSRIYGGEVDAENCVDQQPFSWAAVRLRVTSLGPGPQLCTAKIGEDKYCPRNA